MTNSGIYPNISVVLCYPELISCIYNLQAPNLYRLSENLWRKKRKKKKKKGRRGGQQENLKAVELHLSLRQHLQSALPARKTRKEQPDGGGAVVLSSSQRGGGVVGGGELLCHVIEISKSWSTLLYFSLTGATFAGVSLSSLIIKQRSPLFCRLKGFPNLINTGRNNNNKSINNGNMASSVLLYFCIAGNTLGCGGKVMCANANVWASCLAEDGGRAAEGLTFSSVSSRCAHNAAANPLAG